MQKYYDGNEIWYICVSLTDFDRLWRSTDATKDAPLPGSYR